MSKFRLTRPVAALSALLATGNAFAQAPATPAQAPAAAPAAPFVPAPPNAEVPVPDTAPAAPVAATPESEIAKLRAELAETRKAVEELRAAQEATTDVDAPVGEQEKLKIYGFADVGFQYVQIDKGALLANAFDVNDPDFILGNLNLYFDAQPVEHWRGLMEVRFTNAPHGEIRNLGGAAGTFERYSAQSFDASGAALNAPLWGGTTVIERAWLEYNRLQPLKIRVGNWFTPFGIWNEDHGTPTLISLAWPQFMTQRWMPLRQTGLMLYGNAFAGSWELGYAATLSNGRQELATLNIDGHLGYGGRVYARRDTGHFNTTFGASFFTGKTSDKIVKVVGVDPLEFRTEQSIEFKEYAMGVDASVDIGGTRIRSEAVVRRLTYTPGKRAEQAMILPGNPLEPDKWEHSVYLLVAQQLPGALDAFEPYLWAEAFQTPTLVGDGTFVGSVGLNIHFNSAVQWKNQYAHVRFFDWMYDSPFDPSDNNINQFYSRLVMAF